jgi:hypothetical protein
MQAPARGRRLVGPVIIIAIIAVAAAAVTVFLRGNSSGGSTITAPAFPGYQAMATDSNGAIGIDLSLALNSTTIRQDQDLQSVVQVLNTLPKVNNVSVGGDFPVKPLQSKCLPGDYTPFVIQMYPGHYDRSNITNAAPLQYYLTCPAVFSGSITTESYYLFQPNSANATLYGLNPAHDPVNSGPMSLRFVNGVSVYEFSSSYPDNTFPGGVYTLMLEDWWGQMVTLQFWVAS